MSKRILTTAEELQAPDYEPTPWEVKAIVSLFAAAWALAVATVWWAA